MTVTLGRPLCQRGAGAHSPFIGLIATLTLLIPPGLTPGVVASSVNTSGSVVSATATAYVYQDIKRVPQQKKPAPTVRPGIFRQPQKLYDTTVKIVEGSGEFEFLKDEVVVLEQVPVKLQWTTTNTNAASGHWEVRNVNAGNQVVASGVDSPAPQPGHIRRVSIPAGAFLLSSPPQTDTRFEITIRAFDSSNQPVGSTSKSVYVKQLAASNYPKPIQFGDGAYFPSVKVLSIKETVGQIPQTQLYAAYTDLKLRVSNNSNRETDPMWLKVNDYELLFRQNGAPISVPALNKGGSITVDVRLDAILPPPKSQTPQEQQQREWRQRYADRCGPEFRSVLDWHGPQSQTPMDAHREGLLAAPGWEDYTTFPPSARVCDATQCVDLCDVEQSIHSQLDGNSVGYAYVVGGKSPKFGAGGYARTSANGSAVEFTTQTPITVASVSKWVTAIAAMRILDLNKVSLNAAIGPFFPDDWNVGQYFQSVTFAQLLGQQSGIKDYGNVDLTYSKLKSFFEQPVDISWTPQCTGSGVTNPPNAVNPSAAMTRCYSNYNFAIFRILLPRVAGLPVDNNTMTRAMTLANQYEQLVRQNEFELVGQTGTGCRPSGSAPHAFAYKYPGTDPGFDWGDVRLTCGAAGWYLSAEDMAKVLFSVNTKDGRILDESGTTSPFAQMRTQGLGLDNFGASLMEKNGGWGANGGTISTSAAIFGPVSGPNVVAVLFINSDISGGPNAGKGARQVLVKAYNDSLKPK